MDNSSLNPRYKLGLRELFVPEIVAFGGGERVYLALLRYLNSKNIPHSLVSYYQSIDMSSYADWTLEVETLNPHRNPFLKSKALKRKFSVSDTSVPPLLVGLQGAMHAAAFGLKNYSVIVLDTPSLMAAIEYKGLRKLFKGIQSAVSTKLTRIGLERAKHVITNTNYLADEIETLYGIRPLISYPGAPGDPHVYEYRRPKKKQTLRLLSVCRLEKTKRLDWIMRSLSELQQDASLAQDDICWQLDIVGTGALQTELQELSSRLGIRDKTVFHGHITDEELENIYSFADVFLMPAVQGYGLPALEALTHKIPVLMHRDSGVSEVLQGSPWVEIIDGGKETLTQGLRIILERAGSGELEYQPLPHYPTEAEWAEDVCRKCEWIV